MTYDIVPPHLAVKAMRDNGYKNAAYALAELIDNSIQAGAKNVSLLCAESRGIATVRQRSQISEIAVLDDGCGMDSKTLRSALQFGNGSHLKDRTGIGRFGMGLPNSSISQAARVEVWTWSRGTQPIYAYLDIDEINQKQLTEVPEPIGKPVPATWKLAAGGLPDSGTLVVWKRLDRCQWRTAKAIIENSEHLIGRIYRRFIHSGKVAIQLRAFDISDPGQHRINQLAKPNDPLYLMENTSCPEPWGLEAMFEPYGSPHRIEVRVGDVTATVTVRFTIAKTAARQGVNAGAKDHGKHASHNVGVSIMRADRELELQLGWTSPHDPRERWWGAEVEFSPELDEIFGVTNNKQCAQALADIATLDVDEIAEREGFALAGELQDAWKAEDDPRLILLRIKIILDSNLMTLRKQLRAQGARDESNRETRHDVDSAEARGTEATRQRQRDGHQGESDSGESLPPEQRKKALVEGFKEAGLEPEEATSRAASIIEDQRKFEFVHSEVETEAFFTVRSKGGAILIQLNTTHPAYDHLVELLEQDPDESDVEALRSRMRKSHRGLKLLIEAWARYEDELPEAQKDRARQARSDWGRVARQFLMGD